MRAVAALLLIAGCGRISFDPQPDGAVTDAAIDAAIDALPDASLAPCIGTHELYPTATYDEAVTACASFGGWLVTVDDLAENDYVQSLSPTTMIWIGYNDRVVEGTFAWVGPSSSYTRWIVGQPNDGGGGTTEDCVALRTTGLWSDEDCTTEAFPFVCQCP